ncbi:MAG TPA: chemotaxis-specific protein-glutamate methyltransferase CheB [Chthoniobacter sp.]|jgi:two-component system chemotaxis response regulator CheB
MELSVPIPERKINALVVDDSEVARQLLTHILEGDPKICVVGTAKDGQAAVDFVTERRPDIVLMDINMPGMDGFEATRRIMETSPVPIVICSGVLNPNEVATTFRVMEAGGLTCIEKPPGPEHPEYAEKAATVRQMVRLMAEVKVVRRWPASRMAGLAAADPFTTEKRSKGSIRFVGIGASTGGPPALQTILAGLPKDFPAPILIVQHIARGFLSGLADWLNQTTPLQVHIGGHSMRPLPGHVYLAPDDFHMGVNTGGFITLSTAAAENGLRPAVSYMFRSLAENCGAEAVGVLLTGMGRDGAVELKQMRDTGALTIAQDRESSVVHGMPAEAIARGGAVQILPPERIAVALSNLVQRKTASGDFSL